LETRTYVYESTKEEAKVIISKLKPNVKVYNELKYKRYMFNFIGGGWNTVSAKTKAGAKKEIKRIYGDIKSKPDYDSIHLCGDKDYDVLCSLSR